LSLSRFLYPLDEFYAQANRGLPAVELVSGEDVPEPYKSLLLHSNDMTPALEKYHGETLHLKILNRQQRDDAYFREVVLATDETGNPVEDGAIKINLLLFPPNARLQILQERLPLGHILAELKILHRSRPEV
jgi:chorismate-pyruvate lyase